MREGEREREREGGREREGNEWMQWHIHALTRKVHVKAVALGCGAE